MSTASSASGSSGNVAGVDGERKPSDARTQGAPILEKYWCDRGQRSSRKALPCDVRERSATQQIADAVCSRQNPANVAGHITRSEERSMTEPREIADHADQVTEGVWTWAIANSRIGGSTSSSHLVDTDDGAVMIDPVRLAPEALAELPAPRRVYPAPQDHPRAAGPHPGDLRARGRGP